MFLDVLRQLDDPMPYMRGIVAELGFARKEIEYTQRKRRAGTTKNNWYTLYDMAMLGITSYSKVVMRLATISGFIIAGLSFAVAMYYLIMKLIYWDRFPLGTAPIIISIFFLGSIQLFFIGFLGEYILNINTRVIKRPLVVEEQRINF
jgi:polyisoprenyl-phosphate glycosyltransferase